MIPTGNTSEIVKEFYNYLYSYYYWDALQLRPQKLLWSSPLKIGAWGAALIILFFLLTTSFYQTHYKKGDLYEVMSFSGSILERNGKVEAFTYLWIIGLFVVAIYFGIRSMIVGYLY